MFKIQALLTKEYANAYDSSEMKQFSIPKIYNANQDLTKRWYVYYSFRNPNTKKLERQTPIYAGVNLLKTLKDRSSAVKKLCKTIEAILNDGFNPYDEDSLPVDQIKKYNIPDAVTFILELKKELLKYKKQERKLVKQQRQF